MNRRQTWTLRLLPALLAATVAAALTGSEALPGVWAEFEDGGWGVSAKDHAGASGGRRIAWFDQPGRATFLDFELDGPMPRAVLFLRYARPMQEAGTIEVDFGRHDGSERPQLAQLGTLAVPQTGGNAYRWLSLPVGDLAAGRYRLVVRVTLPQGGGEFDVAGLAPDDPAGRWLPPEKAVDGALSGPGRMPDAPRGDDRLAPEALAALRARAEARAAQLDRERQERRARNAHISDPARRLPIACTWWGNDVHRDAGDAPGHTPHNVADIHVAADGTLYTNVHWEEGGANVSAFRDGAWQGDARVGNHGGGRAVAANAAYVYFAGNRHRTGEQGIDRRPRATLGSIADNRHADCGTVHGLAADERRVYASVPGEGRIKVLDADLAPLAAWEVPGAGKLALDGQGRLWVALPGQRAVVRLGADGGAIGPRIDLEAAAEPADIAIDAQGRLLVADGGPSEQILVYEDLDRVPRLAARFGERGGVYAGTPGRLGDRRFVRLAGVGADAAGNLYVASRPSNNGSTILESYAPDGALRWRRQCHVWLDCPDVHPDDPDLFVSSSAVLRVDLAAAAGADWTARSLTVGHRTFTDDVRHQRGGSGSTFVRRLAGGRLLQYLINMDGKEGHVFRFDPARHGDLAIPAGAVLGGGVWTDRDGDGRRDFAGVADAELQLAVSGRHRDGRLHLMLTVRDGNGFAQSLAHETAPRTVATRAGFGLHAGGERRFAFTRFTLRSGTTTAIAAPPAREGFALGGGQRWEATAAGLRGMGNRKGGRPDGISAWREAAELAPGEDFDLELTVRLPRGRLFTDSFGLLLLNAGPGARGGEAGLAAVVDAGQGFPAMQWREGLGGEALAGAQLGAEVARLPELPSVGLWVDSAGTFWDATHGKGIRRLPLTGWTPAGAPVYDPAAAEVIPAPEPFTELRRIHAAPERGGMLLLNGFTSEHPNVRHHWKRAGKVIRRYDDWAPGRWNLRWELVPPYEDAGGGNDGDGNLMSFDVAGDYLFVAREGQSRGLGVGRMHVEVYRLDDAGYVGWMEPPPGTGHVGILDITHGLRAVRRADGEYLVLLEDGASARTLVYRWRPAP